MRISSSLSTDPDAGAAAREATLAAGARLDHATPTLAVVFASPDHAEAAEEIIAAVHEAGKPQHLIGCVAEAIVANEREVEATPAVVVWLAAGGEVETYHMEFLRTSDGGVFTGYRFEPSDPGVHLLLPDPYSFPVDFLLHHLDENVPGTVLVGGQASGGSEPGQSRLFIDRQVVAAGAVGARLRGVRVRTLVSQGCRPIGRPYTVTRAEGNVIFELGGETPLDRLRSLVAGLPPEERALLQRGLHVGRVIDEYKDELGRGDFLIRGVLGADQETGAVAVGDEVDVGQTVQFHVRDADSADEDLRAMLARARDDLGDVHPAGALLFTCNGRGSRLFTTPDHDAGLVTAELGGLPVAGFFAAGELGPVGGRNHLHGFTASLAVFVDED